VSFRGSPTDVCNGRRLLWSVKSVGASSWVCGRSGLFYHGLFGGDLLFAPRIPPYPTTPSVESWFVGLGNHFVSITPVFPDLKLVSTSTTSHPPFAGLRAPRRPFRS